MKWHINTIILASNVIFSYIDPLKQLCAAPFVINAGEFGETRRRSKGLRNYCAEITFGLGAEVLQPLAIAVIGGVSVSMVPSLLVTPVSFYLMRRHEQ